MEKMDEPAEQLEIFQYELIKLLKKMNKNLEEINNHLEKLSSKKT